MLSRSSRPPLPTAAVLAAKPFACRPHPLAAAMRSAFMVCAIAGGFLAAAPGRADAQSAAAVAGGEKHAYRIAAGSLDQVLNRFAGEAGVELSVDSALTQGKTSPGLSGSYTVNEGFEQIVRGQGLRVLRSGRGAYSLRAAPASPGNEATALPTVNVTAEGLDPARQINPPTTVGSKTPLTLREIPQSVTIVSQEQIQQQNMRTLNDAMRYTPGITVSQDDSERTSYYSRGFQIDTWLQDGVPTTQNLASVAPNLAMYDRVEVLRGPDGLLNGFGSAGGAINLVRKRAPKVLAASVDAFAGTRNDLGGQVDIGSPLNRSGSVRGRIVAAAQNQDLMQDSTWRKDRQFYGTVEADLTPDTTARAGISYSNMSQKAMWIGLQAYPVGANLADLDPVQRHRQYAADTGMGPLRPGRPLQDEMVRPSSHAQVEHQ